MPDFVFSLILSLLYSKILLKFSTIKSLFPVSEIMGIFRTVSLGISNTSVNRSMVGNLLFLIFLRIALFPP
ncbi:MAG: hypothetical protein ACRC1P_06675 [Cellulosilyticaceae bacterium]